MPTDSRARSRSSADRRLLVAAALACALMLCGAFAAVVARGAGEGGERAAAARAAAAFEGGPEARRLAAAREQAVDRELQREARRRSPEARADRARTRTAFAELAAGDAIELGRQQFPAQLDAKPWRGLELKRDERVAGYVGERAARVERQGKADAIVQSTLPLRAVDEQGRKAPVDLALEDRGGHFESANPLVDVEFSKDPSGGAELERSGVSVALVGVDGAARVREESDRVVVPEALTDTDAWTAPLPSGFQTFALLRSQDSPEQLVYAVEMPAGDELREGPGGSAEVVRDGERIVSIGAPIAWDADEEPVEVEMTVDGSRLVLAVPHRGEDVRYPLLVDPTIDEAWDWELYDSGELGWVQFASSGSLFDAAYLELPHRWGDGLYVFTRSGSYVPSGAWAGFYFDPPGATTYVDYAAATLSHDNRSSCVSLGASGLPSDTDCGPSYDWGDHVVQYAPGFAAQPGGNAKFVLSSTASMTRTEQTKAIAAMSIAEVRYSDNDNPTLTGFSGGDTLWRKSWAGVVSGTLADTGVGLAEGRLHVPGTAPEFEEPFGFECAATWDDPCPASMPFAMGLDTTAAPLSAIEGRYSIKVSAKDALGHETEVTAGQLKLDKSGPVVNLSGALWDSRIQGAIEPTLAPGSHALNVATTDGTTVGGPTNERSGVRILKVRVDGENVLDTGQLSCPTGNCAVNRNWSLSTAEFPAGKRTVTVIAEDVVGNKTTTSFDVKVPPAGELLWPGPGASTSRWLPIQARADVSGYATARFQYRRNGYAWADIPASALRDEDGQPVSSVNQSLVGNETQKLTWDVAATSFLFLGNHVDEIEVRAVFAGGNGGTSKAVAVSYDPRGLSTDDAREDVGVGQVNLSTGNLTVTASDASVSSWGSPVTVTRALNSRQSNVGGSGPFGPGWTVSAPVEGASEYSSLEEWVDPEYGDRVVQIATSGGGYIAFWEQAPGSGTFTGEESLPNLKLSKPAEDRYELKDDGGSSVTFKRLTGTTSLTYMPTEVRQPGSANTSGVAYEMAAGKPRLKRLIAPAAGVDCSNPNTRGCRSLTLVYATAKTATGFSESQWGTYTDRVERIELTAWDPATSAMRTDTVSQYLYDAGGSLRAQWDPRVSPALKTRYSYDAGGRLTQIAPTSGPAATLAYQSLPSDQDGGRLRSVSQDTPQGTATTTVVYGVPVSGAGAPYEMGRSTVATWGQSDFPIGATAIFPPDSVPASNPPSSYARATVHYLDRAGNSVNTASPGGAIATSEHDRYGNVIRSLSPTNRARALASGGLSAQVARTLDTQREYQAEGQEMKEELGPQHEVKLPDGQVVEARKRTVVAYDEGAPSDKDPHLPTTTTVTAAPVGGAPDVHHRVTKTEYDWTLRAPTKTIVDPTGLNSVTLRTFDTVTGLPATVRPPSGKFARYTNYYKANGGGCSGYPEWENLPCKSSVLAVDGSTVIPTVAKTFTYNRLNQVVRETKAKSGEEIWTDNTYDAAGRPLTSKMSASGQATGLVAAYGFEETSGSGVVDGSAQGNGGTIENGAARVDEGRYGRALKFDGADDRVRVADSPSLDLPGTMTLEAWVRPDNFTAFSIGNVIGRQGSATGCNASPYALAAVVGTQAMGMWCGAAVNAPSGQPLRAGVWSHLAVTRQGTTLRLYVDGVQVAQGTAAAAAVDVVGDLLIGDGYGASYSGHFAGLIDEVRVYDRALSATEISSDMRRPVEEGAGSPPAARADLRAAYGFEEETTTKIHDSSGNGNHGTSPFTLTRSSGGRHGAALANGAATATSSASLNVSGGVTVEGWLSGSPSSGWWNKVIAEKGAAYSLKVIGGNMASFSVRAGATTKTVTASLPWTTVHLAGTYDGQNVRLFVNGTQQGSTALTGNVVTVTNGLVVGDTGGGARIDEVRVYGSALNATQLAEDAARPIAEARRTPTNGAALPAVSFGYDPATGQQTTMSTTENGVTRTLTTGYDSLGRVTSYTDADGNTSTTAYDLLGRATSVSDGKGTQTFGYDATTGDLTQLTDSQAGTFTASYDADGKLISQTYPNNLRADTIYDETGDATDLTYTKQGCSSNCTWFEEHVISTIHGQWRMRDSSLSDQEYGYDKLGRLYQVKDTPTGQGCTTRVYAFDADSNRTSRTSHAPDGAGACSTSTSSQVQSMTYDKLDRVTNAGFEYDTFGRNTAVPATHSGGDVLQTRYYLNDMVQSQTQGSVTQGWLLDPMQTRARATTPSGSIQEILHYSDGSDSPAWSEVRDGTQVQSWERTVSGIDGGLAAIVSNDGTTTTAELQLANLHGDITATASTNTGATAPTATFESDEFGNPRQGAAKKYGWLGGKERRSVLPSGVIQMGVRSYVPAMGRFTSVDPVVGGSHNDYEYAGQDPLNSYDLDGRVKIGRCDIRHNWTGPKLGIPPKPARVTAYIDKTCTRSISRRMEEAGKGGAEVAGEICANLIGLIPGPAGIFVGGGCTAVITAYWYQMKFSAQYASLTNRCLTFTVDLAPPPLGRPPHFGASKNKPWCRAKRRG